MGCKYLTITPPNGRVFDNISNIGTCNLTQRYDKSGKNFYDNDDGYFEEFSLFDPESASIITEGATSREVRPIVKNVEAAIRKNDNKANYPKIGDELADLAFKYAERTLKPFLSQKIKMPYEDRKSVV